MPFADYDSFEDCVNKNQDKDDPEAYCAAIERETEGKALRFLSGALQAVKDLFKPQDSTFRIYKTKDGSLRWVGIVSNQWRDQDNPPEIISSQAHENYIKELDESGDYPPLRLWHTEGAEIGMSDFAEFSHGCVITSGVITNERAAKALKGMNLGMSHGFEFKYSNADDHIIGWYKPFEYSVLPKEFAANQWTSVEMLQEDDMRPEKQAFLEKTLGKEATEKLLGQIDNLEKELTAAGIEWKDAPEKAEEKVEQPIEEKAEDHEAAIKALTETATYKAITATTKEIAELLPALRELPGKIEAMQKAIDANAAAIRKTHDEIVAEAVRPRGGYQPTKDKENIVQESDQLKEARPIVDGGFLSSIT